VPLTLAATLALATADGSAHGVEVFAYAEGARIQGSAHFAGGSAAGLRVLIQDSAGSTLAELTPADDGSFSYRARDPLEHRIIAQSADGHRAEWRVTAEELAAGFPGHRDRAGAGIAAGAPTPPRRDAETVSGGRVAVEPAALDPLVEAAIGRAVARQVGPLRQELAADRRRARLQDVLGGIGYIVGLAGFALWWRSRHPQRLDGSR
jgi:nickel transport protein